MPIPRRFFLKSGMLTALSAGFALRNAGLVFGQKKGRVTTAIDYRIPIRAQQEPTYYFTRATFDPYVGDIFQAPNARGKLVTLKLLSVSSYKPQATTKISTKSGRDTDAFSLLFSASEPLPAFTSIHKISHPALGKFDLFLTPRKATDGTILYEAVFNHVH